MTEKRKDPKVTSCLCVHKDHRRSQGSQEIGSLQKNKTDTMQPKVIRVLLLITQVTFNNTILLIFEARLCVCMCAQLYPTLCSPMDYSPPSSAVHRISQARILE